MGTCRAPALCKGPELPGGGEGRRLECWLPLHPKLSIPLGLPFLPVLDDLWGPSGLKAVIIHISLSVGGACVRVCLLSTLQFI